MRVVLYTWVSFLLLGADAHAASVAAGMTCTVNDPTTTALNLRATPRGTLLSTIPNGQSVDIQEVRNDNRGLRWARLDRPRGWVYANYLNCSNTETVRDIAVGMTCTVNDPTTTALNLRAAPRGTLLSTLPNGQSVEIQELRNDDRGLPWARLGSPQGWVYANFLNCVSPAVRQTEVNANNSFDPLMELNRNGCTVWFLRASRTYNNYCRRSPDYDFVCIQRDGGYDFLGSINIADQCMKGCAAGNCGMSNIEILNTKTNPEGSYIDERPWYQEYSFSARGIQFFCKSGFSRLPGEYYRISTLVACNARQE
ncbi:MAG: SH3 domain-containing protein [Mesorhizobium sp.]|nr:MAG: SH3 domain-containing protein [Mesorhizobium sp.]